MFSWPIQGCWRHALLVPWLALVFIGSAPKAHCQTDREGKPHATEEDKIYEAVLRLQMVNWYRSRDAEDQEAAKDRGVNGPHDKNYKTFLLFVNGNDPSDEFIRRFKDIPRQLKPASKGHYVKEPFPGWLRDTDTNDRVVEFYVGRIDWKSDVEAEVGGGYYCGGLCAGYYQFKVKKSGGKWVIISSLLKMVA